MEIQELQSFEAPNIFSLREPIIKMKVELGEFVDTPTKDIGNINDEIVELFPGIKSHKCSTGYEGGFVERLKEGTYLAHVTEHLCLETQRMLGYDVKYGKSRSLEDGSYSIIFSCPHTIIGKACGTFVINILNDLIGGKKVNFEENLRELKTLCLKYDYGVSTSAMINEARKRGIPVNSVGDGDLIRLGYGKYQKCISATLFEGTSSIAVDSACNKSLAKELLDEASIPTPEGKICLNEVEAIQIAKEIGYPVVVKPNNGSKGKSVFVDLKNEEELKSAFSQATITDDEIIVERFIKGKDYRLLVVGGDVVAAAERIPAHVIGDGQHTIKELIDIENESQLRGEGHERPLTKIKIDENITDRLEKQGLSLTDVPKRDQVIKLKENANLSTGGIAIDCTDLVHPENKKAAALSAKVIGLDIAGIDMIIPDISKPISRDYGAIVEVNAAPGIRMHLNPTKGQKRNVGSAILDMIYPAGEPFTIPIVAVTGTNGKTTTTRLISRILRNKGYNVGTTTTHGIYLNDECIEEGDTTGPRSAKRILNHCEVDAAVLEIARGGILREGLAYENADIGVFTNLSEDHLGIDGIDTMEDLLRVKSLVIETVKDDGACILNADDPWVIKVKDRARGDIVLLSIDDSNPHVKEHIDSGGIAIFVKDGSISMTRDGQLSEIIKVDEIPATLNGALTHNIYNSMAAIGACIALDISIDPIRKTLRGFACDADVNPGRFNIYELDGNIKVVLDYGHNIDGYKVTIEGLKSLNPTRMIGVIGVPGDRKDDDILRIGNLSGASFDLVVIKEDYDSRGREPYEVANLLKKGVIEGGLSDEKIEIITEEEKALRYTLQDAKDGDVIAVFFEKMEPLIDLIDHYRIK